MHKMAALKKQVEEERKAFKRRVQEHFGTTWEFKEPLRLKVQYKEREQLELKERVKMVKVRLERDSLGYSSRNRTRKRRWMARAARRGA